MAATHETYRRDLEAIALVEAHAERFQAMIYLAVDSGMRWGELIGFQRKDVDLAARVAAGGHDVPEHTVRRRSMAGLRYFFALYRRRVDEWALYDNEAGGPVLIASGGPPRRARARDNDVRQTPSEVERDFEVE